MPADVSQSRSTLVVRISAMLKRWRWGTARDFAWQPRGAGLVTLRTGTR